LFFSWEISQNEGYLQKNTLKRVFDLSPMFLYPTRSLGIPRSLQSTSSETASIQKWSGSNASEMDAAKTQFRSLIFGNLFCRFNKPALIASI